jgi:hypothetical protein
MMAAATTDSNDAKGKKDADGKPLPRKYTGTLDVLVKKMQTEGIYRGWFQGKDVSVDHLIGAGSLKTFSDLAGFAERLFCEADGLQVLCKSCHQTKTNHERGLK